MTLTKPTIEKIDFGEYTDEVKRIWEGLPPNKLLESYERRGLKLPYYNAGTMKARYCRIKQLIGYHSNLAYLVGYCATCRTLNTHLVRYKVDGAVIIERFCSEHLPKEYS
ncbi:MAG: hypothetical protein ACRD93_05020 [Nitrososphaeraceae archaeon]